MTVKPYYWLQTCQGNYYQQKLENIQIIHNFKMKNLLLVIMPWLIINSWSDRNASNTSITEINRVMFRLIYNILSMVITCKAVVIWWCLQFVKYLLLLSSDRERTREAIWSDMHQPIPVDNESLHQCDPLPPKWEEFQAGVQGPLSGESYHSIDFYSASSLSNDRH